jgi:hypothetical protein
VEVIDADKEARARTVKVKVAAHDQPVLPAAPAGVPFLPVEFTGLTVMSSLVVDTHVWLFGRPETNG